MHISLGVWVRLYELMLDDVRKDLEHESDEKRGQRQDLDKAKTELDKQQAEVESLKKSTEDLKKSVEELKKRNVTEIFRMQDELQDDSKKEMTSKKEKADSDFQCFYV